MLDFENNCVHCERCIHCGRDKQPILICDRCGWQEELYEYDGLEVCHDCLMDMIPKVRVEDKL